MLDDTGILVRRAESLQCLVFRRGGEGEVAGIGQQLFALAHGVDLVLVIHIRVGHDSGQRHVHCARGLSVLAGMCFVNDDGEMPILVILANLGEDIREFFNGRDDDAPSVLDGLAQIAGVLRPCDDIARLRKLSDGISDLLIQHHSVCDYNDGVHQQIALRVFQPGQLMCQPCNGIGLAAARAVLDEIAIADAVLLHISQQAFHRRQLMIAREDLLVPGFAGFLVLFLDQRGVVLDDAREHVLGQNLLPQVIRHQAVRVGRIACAVLVALVEGQKPALLALQAGAELDLRIVHGEVNHAAGELEQQLLRAAGMLVLIDRIVHVLLGQLVFQLEGDDRQAVDEDAQIQRQLRGVGREMELARNAEDVLCIQRCGGGVIYAGRHIEHDEAGGISLDAFAQHVNNAALGDFIADTGEKLRRFLWIGFQLELFHRVRLSVF